MTLNTSALPKLVILIEIAIHPKKKGQIMAKDKSKKKSKADASDEFAKPSEAPAGGDGWVFASDENDGELFLITPLREDEIADTFSKQPGATKKIIVADVVHLNEKKPAKSEEHEEVYIFGGWLMGAVRGFIGERRVLGRLDKAADKKSATGYVWKFEDADTDDVEIAREYLASLNPFESESGGEKSKDKKSKKGKK